MRYRWLVAVLTACGGTPPSQQPVPRAATCAQLSVAAAVDPVPRPDLEFLPDAMIVLRNEGETPWLCRARPREVTKTARGIVLSSDTPLDVVKIERDRMRVVIDDGATRVLAWLPRMEFVPVVKEHAAAAIGRRDETSKTSRILLEPGFRLDDHRDGWWRGARNGSVAFQAWVPAAVVADFYLVTGCDSKWFPVTGCNSATTRRAHHEGPHAPARVDVRERVDGDAGPPGLPVPGRLRATSVRRGALLL